MKTHLLCNFETISPGPWEEYVSLFPVNISKDHLIKLVTNRYYLTPHPRGNRSLLHLQTTDAWELDKTHLYTFYTRDLAFTGTVLDGDFTRQSCKGKQSFVIIDATQYNGEDLAGLSIVDRLAIISRFIITIKNFIS